MKERENSHYNNCKGDANTLRPSHLLLVIIIHQIFSLTRDWSKHVTWANITQLKLGNITSLPAFCLPILISPLVANQLLTTVLLFQSKISVDL